LPAIARTDTTAPRTHAAAALEIPLRRRTRMGRPRLGKVGGFGTPRPGIGVKIVAFSRSGGPYGPVFAARPMRSVTSDAESKWTGPVVFPHSARSCRSGWRDILGCSCAASSLDPANRSGSVEEGAITQRSGRRVDDAARQKACSRGRRITQETPFHVSRTQADPERADGPSHAPLAV